MLRSRVLRGDRIVTLREFLLIALAYGGAINPVQAGCELPGAPAPTLLPRFLAAPETFLARYPRGERGLTWDVRHLATNPEALKSLIVVIRSANSDQRRAIGEGLGSAASACLPRAPDVTRQIGQAVQWSGNAVVALAYRRAFGESSSPPLPASLSRPQDAVPSRGPSKALGSLSPDNGSLALPDSFAPLKPVR